MRKQKRDPAAFYRGAPTPFELDALAVHASRRLTDAETLRLYEAERRGEQARIADLSTSYRAR